MTIPEIIGNVRTLFGYMIKKFFIVLPLIYLILVKGANAVTPEIAGPDMEIINNNIYVSLSVINAAELEEIIKSGIEKELIFTVELLHAWRFWPDEFVVSKQIKKIIKYDNLRERYRVTINDGIKSDEMYFKDYFSIRDWIFMVKNINIANVKELTPGDYYVRIVVESKSIEHLPFLGLLMLFIPEVEMSMAKESAHFRIGGTQ